MSVDCATEIVASIKLCDLKINQEDVIEGNDITKPDFIRILQVCKKKIHGRKPARLQDTPL